VLLLIALSSQVQGVSSGPRWAELHLIFYRPCGAGVKPNSIIVRVRINSWCHGVNSLHKLGVTDRSSTAVIRRDATLIQVAVVGVGCRAAHVHSGDCSFVDSVTLWSAISQLLAWGHASEDHVVGHDSQVEIGHASASKVGKFATPGGIVALGAFGQVQMRSVNNGKVLAVSDGTVTFVSCSREAHLVWDCPSVNLGGVEPRGGVLSIAR